MSYIDQGDVTPVPSVLPSATAVKIESSIKKPANQRTSSVGEGSLGQQPTRYANTTIDTNVVDKDLWFSLQERITYEMLVCRKLCYSQSSARKCISQWSSVIFSKSQGPFSILAEFDRSCRW